MQVFAILLVIIGACLLVAAHGAAAAIGLVLLITGAVLLVVSVVFGVIAYRKVKKFFVARKGFEGPFNSFR